MKKVQGPVNFHVTPGNRHGWVKLPYGSNLLPRVASFRRRLPDAAADHRFVDCDVYRSNFSDGPTGVSVSLHPAYLDPVQAAYVVRSELGGPDVVREAAFRSWRSGVDQF